MVPAINFGNGWEFLQFIFSIQDLFLQLRVCSYACHILNGCNSGPNNKGANHEDADEAKAEDDLEFSFELMIMA